MNAGQVREYVNKREVAAMLGVSRRTIDNLMRAGRIPFFKLSRKLVRFHREDLNDYLRKTCRIAGRGAHSLRTDPHAVMAGKARIQRRRRS